MDLDEFDLPRVGRGPHDANRNLMPWHAQARLQAIVDGPRYGEVGGVTFDFNHPDLPPSADWHAPGGAIPWGISFPWDRAMYDGDEEAAAVWVTNAYETASVTQVYEGDSVRVLRVERFHRGGDVPPLADEHDETEWWAYLTVERLDGSTVEPPDPVSFCARDALTYYSPYKPKDEEGYDEFLRHFGITFAKLSLRIDRLRKNRKHGWEWLELAYLTADIAEDEKHEIESLGLRYADDHPLDLTALIDTAAAAGYALAKAEEAIRLLPLARRGLKAQRSQQAATRGAKRRADPVRALAREIIRDNPHISQTRCAMLVASKLGRDQRSVERLIEGLFEWRDLAAGIREKRPRAPKPGPGEAPISRA